MSEVPAKIGAYAVEREIGRGGMGVVYLAQDPRLGRPVAIKVLPAEFAADPERLARFEREARLLAALRHPNIAGIYGLEDDGPRRFLALEYVDGETLAERLARGALPLTEALEVAVQVAAALESAHEAGIVHRDLKPGNVKRNTAGEVKVLDFGLAKGADPVAASPDLTQSPTRTHAATAAGVILGTAAYMSPEQARGRGVDKRSDIWSFGCLLFECLTGRQAFQGETVSDMIALILQGEPEWNALPSRTPSRVRELLRRCLEKDVRRRLRDIGDARIELEDVLARGTSGPVAAADTAGRGPRPGVLAAGGLAIALAAAALTFGALRLAAPEAPARLVRFTLPEPQGFTLTNDPTDIALSPDGRMLAFVCTDSARVSSLWVREFAEAAPRRLAGTDGAIMPFWSPDARKLGFFAGGKLRTLALAGGEPEVLCDVRTPRGGSWSPGDVILFAPLSSGPIMSVPASGGEPRVLVVPDTARGQQGLRFPQVLPDGKRFTCCAVPAVNGRTTILLGALGSPRADSVGSYVIRPTFAAPGWFVSFQGTRIVAQRVDPRSLRPVGEPRSLPDLPFPTNYAGAPIVTCAASGTLALCTGILPRTRLAWLDREAREKAPVAVPAGRYVAVSLSPDGHRAIVQRISDSYYQELVLVDLDRGIVTPFSDEQGDCQSVAWSPDGARVAYLFSLSSGPQSIIVRSVNGDRPPETLLAGDHRFKNFGSWTPDGKYLVFEPLEPATRHDLWLLPMEGDRTPRAYLAGPGDEDKGVVSRDGRWMAYVSDESGRPEVYLRSFPDPAKKYQVTNGGSLGVGWLTGERLAYAAPGDPDHILVAPVLPGDEPRLGPAQPLARGYSQLQGFDVVPDGSRAIGLLPASRPPANTITVILDWTAALGGK